MSSSGRKGFFLFAHTILRSSPNLHLKSLQFFFFCFPYRHTPYKIFCQPFFLVAYLRVHIRVEWATTILVLTSAWQVFTNDCIQIFDIMILQNL